MNDYFPLVSIIVPTFNREKLIIRALESIFTQTYPNIEIIIVDDNSSDNTESVVKELNRKNIKYFKHLKNTGGGGARNTGILNATGDFLTFLDSDDEYINKKIETQINYFLNSKCDDKTILFAPVIMNDGKHSVIIPEYRKINNLNIVDYIFVEEGLIQTNTIFLKSDFAKKVLFDNTLRKHQDYDFVLRASKLDAKFEMTEQPLTIWYTDYRADRMGRKSEYEYSYGWLQKNKSSFSTQAYAKFIVRDILGQVQIKKFSWKAFAFLTEMFLKNELPLKQYILNSVKLFIINPKKVFK